MKTTMKLAVISDIHGNLVALEAALADLESVGEVDQLWILGDLATGGPRPSECIQRVLALQEQYGEDRCKIIGGNADRYLVTGERFVLPPVEDEDAFNQLYDHRTGADATINWNLAQINWDQYQFLAKILHREISLHVKGFGHVIGYHAVPGNDEAILSPETPDEEAADTLLDREGWLAIGGHIHRQMDRVLADWRVVNVGSVGRSLETPGSAQWGLFTFEDGGLTVDLRVVPYDTGAAIADFQTVGMPDPAWSIRRFQLDR
jgi:predicted phosphodiesterase